MISYHYASPAPGKKRREDSFFTNDTNGIYLIGDGLTDENGNMASALATNNMGKELESFLKFSPERDNHKQLQEAIQKSVLNAHELCKKLSGFTTLDCLVVKENSIYGAHLGDSYIYLVQENGSLKKITTRGYRGASNRPEFALGYGGLDIIEKTGWIKEDLQHVRYLFLCTDGLQIEEEEIQAAFFDEKYADKPTEILEELVRRNDALLRKNKNKEPDDLTMIIVDPYWSPTSQQEALSGLQGQIGNLESKIQQREEDHQRQMQQQKTDHAAGVQRVRGEYEPRIRELEQTKRELNTIVTDIYQEIKSVFADLRTKGVLGTEKFSDEYVKNTPVPALLKDLLAFSSANIRNSADSEKGLRASLQDAGRRLYGMLTPLLGYFPSGQAPPLKDNLSSESPLEDLLPEVGKVVSKLGNGYEQQRQKDVRIIDASAAALGGGIGDSMDSEALVGELVDCTRGFKAIMEAAGKLGYEGVEMIKSKLAAYNTLEGRMRENKLVPPSNDDQECVQQAVQAVQESAAATKTIEELELRLMTILQVKR